MFWIDYWYIILVLPAFIIAMAAQMRVNSVYNKYARVISKKGHTSDQVARMILDKNGLYDVKIERVSGELTDHYDPRKNVVRLSSNVYGSASVSAIGIAAHEVGHAIQHATRYAPIQLRSAIIPITNFGAGVSPILLLIGLFMGSHPLVMLGIGLYSLMALFQLSTLPVEVNASRRAIETIDRYDILTREETEQARKVLSSAAMTYVAALLVSLMQILRLLLLFGGRRRD